MNRTVGTQQVTSRPAAAGDIAMLRELFADAHTELAVLPPDSRFILVDMQFRAERRRHATHFPKARHDILFVDDVPVGRALVDRSGVTLRVVDISITLRHRRQGIAGAVLAGILREADEAGRPVWLTVWSGNLAARRMCERAGMDVVTDEGGFLTMRRAATPDAAPGSSSPPSPDRD